MSEHVLSHLMRIETAGAMGLPLQHCLLAAFALGKFELGTEQTIEFLQSLHSLTLCIDETTLEEITLLFLEGKIEQAVEITTTFKEKALEPALIQKKLPKGVPPSKKIMKKEVDEVLPTRNVTRSVRFVISIVKETR